MKMHSGKMQDGREAAYGIFVGMAHGDSKNEPTLHDVMGILHTMNDRMNTVDERLGTIDRRLGNVENKLEDVAETLDAVAQAVDKDAVMLLEHDRRITKLEQV